MSRPRIFSPCVADRYVTKARERIAEFSTADGAGGLIALRVAEGHYPASLTVYQTEGVEVRLDPRCLGAETLRKAAELYAADLELVAILKECDSAQHDPTKASPIYLVAEAAGLKRGEEWTAKGVRGSHGDDIAGAIAQARRLGCHLYRVRFLDLGKYLILDAVAST